MSNVQVIFDTDLNNARSESSLAINPNNLLQVVAASKKFADIHTYNFTLATEYSTDGGQTWSPSSALGLPKGATVMTDPTLAWDDSSNVFLVGLTGYNPPTWNTIGIVIYKSSDGGQTWSPPIRFTTVPAMTSSGPPATLTREVRSAEMSMQSGTMAGWPSRVRPTTAPAGKARLAPQPATSSRPVPSTQRSPSPMTEPSTSYRPTRCR